jgi:hypothetical protein
MRSPRATVEGTRTSDGGEGGMCVRSVPGGETEMCVRFVRGKRGLDPRENNGLPRNVHAAEVVAAVGLRVTP